ncbi:MAG: class I SAM-dependent methyltransferase [Spirochaetales bacterium]|nr:class I SAM-dependent methyltransferase [Spirochaetales bacterium]
MGAGYSSVDIDFYLKLAAGGMRILDVGCGTGRVSLELAQRRKGCVIDAIDSSDAMLAVFMGKMKHFDSRLKSKINIHRMDMRTMSLKGPYDLVVFPFQSFQALTVREEQVRTLRSARSLLNANGRIVISVFDPTFQLVCEEPIAFLQEIIRLRDGSVMVKRIADASIDFKKKTYRFTEHLLAFDSSRVQVEEVFDRFCVAYHDQDNLLSLFREAGLEVLHKYGDYKLTKLKDGEPSFDMIFVLR